MTRDIILTTGPLGGTGDNLLYSTLPERFSKLGYDVWLDVDNTMRNGDMETMIWERNPYVRGRTDRKPNAGYVNHGRFYALANTLPVGAIEAMERAHGLPPPYSIAPKIYYTPRNCGDLSRYVLADFNAVSSRVGPDGLRGFTERMAWRFPDKQFLLVRFPEGIAQNAVEAEGLSIFLGDAASYLDALHTAYAWVGVEAGGQALAAAVRGEHDAYDLGARLPCVALISPTTFNSRGYTFRGVEYHVTNFSMHQGDYWEPVEVPYQEYHDISRAAIQRERAAWEAAQSRRQEGAA
jgi:hypothetical protein